VPEQLPYRVFESRVTFHPPAAGFDADLTVTAGRVYLKGRKLDADKKPVAAKVRVRLPGEVWDVTLPDDKAEVMVELVSWFAPGTAYARKDGPCPKREGRSRSPPGPPGWRPRGGSSALPNVSAGTQLTWDSATGAVSPPKPIAQAFEVASVLPPRRRPRRHSRR
jgi:hypothetical protein